MFNIGFGELAVICIILIVVVGPQRLPTVMKTVGKTMRTLRQASRDIRTSTGIDELMREDVIPVRPPARKPIAPLAPPEGAQVGRQSSAAAGQSSAAAGQSTTTDAGQPNAPVAAGPGVVAARPDITDSAPAAAAAASPSPPKASDS